MADLVDPMGPGQMTVEALQLLHGLKIVAIPLLYKGHKVLVNVSLGQHP